MASESCFLITDACKEVAGRNTHKEIGCEVHHVAHHAEHGVAFKFVAPYRADGAARLVTNEIIAKRKNMAMIATMLPRCADGAVADFSLVL